MEVAAAALSSVLPKLSAMLAEEFNLQKGARSAVMILEAELQRIQEFILGNMEAEPTKAQAIFLRNAQELSYDTEDIIDDFMFRMNPEPGLKLQSFKRFMAKQTNMLRKAKIRNQFAHEIRDIKWRVKEVVEKMERCRRESTVSRADRFSVDPRMSAPIVDASSLVGLDRPQAELIKLLMEGEEDPESAARLKVISIVGPGGLGKTTLAQFVYQKAKVHFDCGFWISVSPNPNVKKILIQVLRQLGMPQISGHDGELDERDLIDNIRKFLQDQRYLFVMDDIWSSDVWDIIRCALPMNNLGSRIIVTTRINSVAESCCSNRNDHIYNMKPLSDDESRRLFLSRIFGSDHDCPASFLDLSDKILNKCSGFPLAIIATSCLLATKPLQMSIWEGVYDSIGATHGRMEGMKSIFLLSYYDLPQHLRVCFLYLSIFPEDYLINRDRVVRSWIAEGFIWTEGGITAEELGESYLNELINRSMIQPVSVSNDGKPEAYRIHDMILELIKSKSIEENFVTFLDNGNYAPVLHSKVRRLSIINDNKYHCIPELEDKSHIRSLYIFGSVGMNLSFKRLTFLRVLDLEGCKDLTDHNIEEVPRLIHLKYLSLRYTSISKLPDQIGRLQFLKILDIRGTKVQELPTSIVQLRMLAHLLCDKVRLPEGIEEMKALSSLSQVDILQSNTFVVKELGNLPKLRELVLCWVPDIEPNNTLTNEHLAVSLYRLDKLESLYIHGSDCSVDFLDCLSYPLRQLRIIQLNKYCYLNRIPERFSELLPRLEYLCIDINEVKNEDLRLLSELPSLIQLSVSSKAMPKEKLVIRSEGFPVLQKFQLHSAKEDLIFEPQAMQKLEELILSCNILPENIYDSIGQFKCIKKIDIRINGKGLSASQLFESTDVSIRKAADKHPNHPVVNIIAQENLIDYEAREENEREENLELVKDK